MFFLRTLFNLAGGIHPETIGLIQDGSSPSLFRDQEIYLLSVLEYNLCQAMLAFIPRNLILVVFIRMHSFAVLNKYLRSARGSQV